MPTEILSDGESIGEGEEVQGADVYSRKPLKEVTASYSVPTRS